MTYVVLLSIGPVQEFIAAARRCQDLWFGSWLLSELSAAAAAGIAELAGGEALIFPGSLDVGRVETARDRPGAPSVANKLLVEVDGGPEGVRAVAEAARSAMNKRLELLRDEVFEKLERSEQWDRELAQEQIAGMMELEWVAVPTGDDYAAARGRAEELLAGRKNTKVWGQTTVTEKQGARPKSALDGQRETVLHEEFFGSNVARRAGVKDREHLCGVGLLKRFGSDTGSKSERPVFHSTSHMASAPLRACIAAAGEKGQRALRKYLEWLKDQGLDLDRFRIRANALRHEGGEILHWQSKSHPNVDVPRVLPADEGELRQGFDGVLLYPNRLHEVFEEGGWEGGEPPLDKGRAHLSALFRAVGAPSEPPAYYAMILADGDRMGTAIDAMTTPEQHRRFSEKLAAAFASQCGGIVAKNGGSLLYAGGDDVLALVPVTNALACAQELRESFDAAMREAIPTGVLPAGVPTPTLSVGVAIAHHMEPMDDVRKLAGRAEKLAKVERDSLAVVLSKRGGGEVEVTAPWSSDLRGRLEQFAEYFRDGDLSHKTPYDLHETLAPLEVSDAEWNAEALDPVVVSLVKRVLARKDASSDARAALAALVDERLRPAEDDGARLGAFTRARALAHELRMALELKDWIVEQRTKPVSEEGAE